MASRCADKGQTVIQAALAAGYLHSVLLLASELVGGRQLPQSAWSKSSPKAARQLDIACNMPVTEGMRVLTDSETVREQRKHHAVHHCSTIRSTAASATSPASACCRTSTTSTTAPVDVDRREEPGDEVLRVVRRIMLDNERCIMCTLCVRFTREVSNSHGARRIQNRGDHSLMRAVRGQRFDDDPYSDNVVDICPVGALLSRQLLRPGARLVPAGDAVGVPRLRARLRDQRLAPQAGVETEPSRFESEHEHRIASRRARIRPSTGCGPATRQETSRRSSIGRAPSSRC
jgi:ferredoxin